MSKDNKVKYGLKNVHYALITETEDGNITFSKPVRIYGAVNISLSPVGDTSNFHADDEEYFTAVANNGYDGTLEMAIIPDSFKTGALGEILDTKKVLIEKTDAVIKPFALLFEFQGDKKARRHVLYYCRATRPNVEGSTKTNSIEVKTDTLNLTCRNIPEKTNVKASTTFETDADTFKNWYTEVYMETAAA